MTVARTFKAMLHAEALCDMLAEFESTRDVEFTGDIVLTDGAQFLRLQPSALLMLSDDEFRFGLGDLLRSAAQRAFERTKKAVNEEALNER